RKRADFPRVSAERNRQLTGSGGKADLTRAATPVVRPPPIFGRRLCRSTVQVDPKANGETALRKGRRGPVQPCPVVPRRGVVRCLSCMRRNGARAVLRGLRHEATDVPVLTSLIPRTEPSVQPLVPYPDVRPE